MIFYHIFEICQYFSEKSPDASCKIPLFLLHYPAVMHMAEYELVREIPNLCRNNQMRDVFFSEIETEDPLSYVREFLKDTETELSVDTKADGSVTIYAVADGLTQKFTFTPI